jgi:hypothetical protein
MHAILPIVGLGLLLGAAEAPDAEAVDRGPLRVPDNRWTRVADVPPDPLGRELAPGRGAFWCFEPGAGVFLRYGGYTPGECNALWTFDLGLRRWANPVPPDWAWPPPAARPGAGAWWSMAYDSKRRVIWLHGGVGVALRHHPELFEDVWQYDPARGTFTAMGAENHPRYGARIVYDSTNDLILRAPAYDGEWAALHNRDATWVYDPRKNAWQRRPTPGSPKHALAGAFVFAPDAGKAVFVGVGRDHRAETWTYDAAANRWEPIDAPERPPARVAAGIAYDARNRRVVLHGGVGAAPEGYHYLYRGGGVQLDDTWALDVGRGRWEPLDVGAPVVPRLPGQRGRRFELVMAMDYDATRQATVLSAPTVGVWALRYRPPGAPSRPELQLAALPVVEKPAAPAGPVYPQGPPNRRLLELEPGRWVELGGGRSLGGGEVPLIYDESTGFCLKYGGCNNGGEPTFNSGYGNDLSAYDPAAERWIALRWTDPCGPPRPENGCTSYAAYDPVRKVTWFAGGTAGNQLASSLPADGAEGTWSYDGLRDCFTLVPHEGAPRVGAGVVCCYDRARNLLRVEPKAYAHNVFRFDPERREWSAGAKAIDHPYTYGCYVETLEALVVIKPGERGARTMAYRAAEDRWVDLAARGDQPAAEGRPTLAYAPNLDVVLCLLAGRTYMYEVGKSTWTLLDAEAPPKLCEMMVFDRRHNVFLATAAMGQSMWAFRHAEEAGRARDRRQAAGREEACLRASGPRKGSPQSPGASLLLPKRFDQLQRPFDQFAAAFGADLGALRDGAVRTAGHRTGRRQVAGATAGKLDDEGLYRLAAGLHLDAEVEVQLERVRGDGHVANPNDVDRHRHGGLGLLQFVAVQHARGPAQPPVNARDGPEPTRLLSYLRIPLDVLAHRAIFPEQPLEGLLDRFQLRAMVRGARLLDVVFRQEPAAQFDLLHAVCENRLEVDVLFHVGKDRSHGIGNAHGDLPPPAASGEAFHAAFGLLVHHHDRRLVAGGGTLREDEQFLTQALT